MKKKLIKVFFSLLLILAIGCSLDPGNNSNIKTGTIVGKAVFSNSEDNSGIFIVLEKTDGLRTAAVSTNSGSRSVSVSVKDSLTVLTDADGNFCFTQVPVGTYTLYAFGSNSAQESVLTNVTVTADQSVTANILKLTATGSLSGVVILDGMEEDNSGFTVFLGGTSYQAKTDSDGNFVISKVPAGKQYDVFIEKGTFTYFWKSSTVKADVNSELGIVEISSEDIQKSTDIYRGSDGKNGFSIIWKGVFASSNELPDPEYLWAYFNSTDGYSYIFDGTKWTLLASKGEDGKNAETIKWFGNRDVAPENPENYWMYYNKKDKKTYMFYENSWNVISVDGNDGNDADVYTVETEDIYKGEDNENLPDGGIKLIIKKNGIIVSTEYIKNGRMGQDGKSAEPIIWKGSLANAPDNPENFWMYYNSNEKKSYLYYEDNWNIVSIDGNDGLNADQYTVETETVAPGEEDFLPDGGIKLVIKKNGTEVSTKYLKNGKSIEPIIWKGSLNEVPENPENNWMYYNSNEKKTYIFIENVWNVVSVDGNDGRNGENADQYTVETETVAAGESVNLPEGGLILIIRKNGVIQSTEYLSNGKSIQPIRWKGSLTEAPEDPVDNWMYYNSTDKKTYMYFDNTWNVVSVDGKDGSDADQYTVETVAVPVGEIDELPDGGIKVIIRKNGSVESIDYLSNGKTADSIVWKGSFESAPANPSNYWMYYDTIAKKTYMYYGESWNVVAVDGQNGLNADLYTVETEVIAAGENESLPDGGIKLVIKKNGTIESTEYLKNGRIGKDGKSAEPIVWKGSFDIAPANPSNYWMYYNAVDKKSYMYYEEAWNVVAVDGKNGIDADQYTVETETIESGEDDALPDGGIKLIIKKNGNEVSTEFIKNGKTGDSAQPIIWKGSFAEAPEEPVDYWMYYNTTAKKTYMYYGETWNVVSVDGQDADDYTVETETIAIGEDDNLPDGGVKLTIKKNGNVVSTDYIRNGITTLCYIYYHLNEGLFDSNVPDYVVYGSPFTLTIPVKEGNEFRGWYLEEDFDGEKIDVIEADGKKSSVNLYAKWVPGYFIEYEFNNGTPGTDTAYFIESSATIQLVDPVRDCYLFKGWYLENDFSGDVITEINAQEISNDVKLYAKWAPGCKLSAAELLDFVPAEEEEDLEVIITDLNPDLSLVKTFIENNANKKIDLNLFACTELTKLTTGVFSGCEGLFGIEIPMNVIEIEEYALTYCYNLEKITIDEENIKFDSRNNSNAIIETEDNKLIQGCKKTIIPNDIECIGMGAFNECLGLNVINIPTGLTVIEDRAFYNCSDLISIEIPSSVTSIGDSVFIGCSELSHITVDEQNEKYDSRENCNAIIETNTSKIILGCKETVIPNGVKSIGPGAFIYCSELRDLDIPYGVEIIEEAAFAFCGALQQVQLPLSLVKIESGAFVECTCLIDVELPSSLISMGDSVFASCTELTQLVIPSNVNEIGIAICEDCESLASVTFVDKENWFVLSDEVETSIDVENPTINVTYFTGNYSLFKINNE